MFGRVIRLSTYVPLGHEADEAFLLAAAYCAFDFFFLRVVWLSQNSLGSMAGARVAQQVLFSIDRQLLGTYDRLFPRTHHLPFSLSFSRGF